MVIARQVYEKILSCYSKVPPEQGGILGEKEGIIIEYFHDDSLGVSDSAIYVPNVELLNCVIVEWNKTGIRFCGMIHSHLEKQENLSQGDVEYIHSIMNNINEMNGKMYFPIIIPTKKIICYVARCSEGSISIVKDEVYVLNENKDKNKERRQQDGK